MKFVLSDKNRKDFYNLTTEMWYKLLKLVEN